MADNTRMAANLQKPVVGQRGRMVSWWIFWLKGFHSKTKESCYVVVFVGSFFMFLSIFDDFVGKLAAYLSSFEKENSHSPFCK